MTAEAALKPSAAPASATDRRRARAERSPDLREHILNVASRLFYTRGVRAVGVDLVILGAGIAKTSLYRYFPTKDDLIVAFLKREDEDFWGVWNAVTEQHAGDPEAELQGHMRWIGERLARSNYRGCPQINTAAEFAEPDHPACHVAHAHMQALRERLTDLAERLQVPRPQELAAQLSVLINGAFVSASLLRPEEAVGVLTAAARGLCGAAREAGRG